VPQGGLIAPPGMPPMPVSRQQPVPADGGINPTDGGIQRANVPTGAQLPGAFSKRNSPTATRRLDVSGPAPPRCSSPSGGMKVHWFTQGPTANRATPKRRWNPGTLQLAQGAIYR